MNVGDVCQKSTGEYHGRWVCLVTFLTLNGKKRVVAESIALPGLLHIFNENQLTVIGPSGRIGTNEPDQRSKAHRAIDCWCGMPHRQEDFL